MTRNNYRVKAVLSIFRKYYTAGIISLVCLPVVCTSYFLSHHSFDKKRALQLNWDDEWFYKDGPVPNAAAYLPLPHHEFTLNGDDSDAVKITAIKSQALEFARLKGMSKGIYVHFQDKAS